MIDCLIKLVESPAQVRIVEGLLGADQCKAGTQQPVVDARAKQRGSTALSGQPIAMGPGNPVDQSMQRSRRTW